MRCCCITRKGFSEAESIYGAILAVDPDNAATWDALGKTLMAKGDMPEATVHFHSPVSAFWCN
jgi:hypothetical protein